MLPVTKGQPFSVFQIDEGDLIDAIALSPDGKSLVAGCSDATIRQLSLESSEPCHVWNGHQDRVCSADFAPEGTKVVSGSWDGTARIWNAKTGETMAILRHGKNCYVDEVVFAPDGKAIATSSAKPNRPAEINLWNALESSPKPVVLSPSEGGAPGNVGRALVYSDDGQFLASGGRHKRSGLLVIWSLAHNLVKSLYKGHADSIDAIAFSPNGDLLASGSADGTIQIRHFESGNVIFKQDVALRRSTLLTELDATADRSVPIAASDCPIAEGVIWVRFVSNGRVLAAGTNRGSLSFWRTSDGGLLGAALVSGPDTRAYAISSDSSTLLVAERNMVSALELQRP